MNLLLRRTTCTENGIFGELYQEDGVFLCYTLEHSYDSGHGDGSYSGKVSCGVYKCVRGEHRLAHMSKDFTTFEVAGVIGHANILFHVGNYNDDSEGCILLGLAVHMYENHPDMITSSVKAFAQFMDLQKDADTFTLTVSNE